MPAAGPASLSLFARDVREGLLRPGGKTLPCQYLYDDIGTTLFQAISLLPEYGLTRADARIIHEHASRLVEILPSPLAVVEFGSGDGGKTRYILEALARRRRVPFYPVDVSASALAACERELSDVSVVSPVRNTYLAGIDQVLSGLPPGIHLLVLFLGSTIGNFQPDEAAEFLLSVRKRLQPGDAFLLGADLVKPEADLLLAYDDPAGVSAAFNLNLLARINRELGGDFDVRAFRHYCRYNAGERRVEMHLRSLKACEVRVHDAGLTVPFDENETIWTEASYKFEPEEIVNLASRSGFRCAEQWIDREWPFAESLLFPAGIALSADGVEELVAAC